MPNFNSCTIMGHITADPEFKQLQNGNAVCDFAVAAHRFKQDQQDVIFLPVTVWGKMGETCKKHLHKGSCVLVAGYLKQENWQANDGSKRSAIKLVAETVQFIRTGGGNDSNQPQPQAQPQQQQQPQNAGMYNGHRYSQADCCTDMQQQQQQQNTGNMDIPPVDDDIPF